MIVAHQTQDLLPWLGRHPHDLIGGRLANEGNVPLKKNAVSTDSSQEESLWLWKGGGNERHVGKTHLENVLGDTRLGNQAVGVLPSVGKARHVEVTHALLRQADDEGNVVLLGDGETGAQHGRDPQTLQQLFVQNVRAVLEANLLAKAPDQTLSSVVHGITLLKTDVLGHVERQLAQSRDHDLVWALGASVALVGLVTQARLAFDNRKGEGKAILVYHDLPRHAWPGKTSPLC